MSEQCPTCRKTELEARLKQAQERRDNAATEVRSLCEQLLYLEEKETRAKKQNECIHYLKDGREAIQLSEGFSDGWPRGTCLLCLDSIHPIEWKWRTMVPEHKDYYRVLKLANERYQP